jgi:hypothetical protein
VVDGWSVTLPALVSEGWLCLWLLVVGVNVERWKEWTRIEEPAVVPSNSHRVTSRG